jgi:hypothetical protein
MRGAVNGAASGRLRVQVAAGTDLWAISPDPTARQPAVDGLEPGHYKIRVQAFTPSHRRSTTTAGDGT